MQPVMTAVEVAEYVHQVFSQADVYDWHVEEVRPGGISVTLKTGPQDIRPGGTVSGPTMFALADITAYLLTLSHIGKVALAVTTNLTINFVNKPEPGLLHAEGEIIKLGKRLVICEIRIYNEVPKSGNERILVSHATATYSVPPRDR